MFPQLERVTVQLGALGAVGATALGARAADLGGELLGRLPPELIFVGWVIGATVIAIQFAARYGRRITRTPAGEFSRLREELASERTTRAALDRRRERQLEQLDERLDGLAQRVAHIEGSLGAPVVVGGKST